MADFYDTRGGSHWPLEESGTLDYTQQFLQSVDGPTFDAIFDDPWLSSGLGMFDATTANGSLQPYLDPLSAAIPDTTIPDMIQTQFLDTAAAQHLNHRSLQPFLDPLSAAIPDTAIPDMIQTQSLDTAAAQHLEHRGFLESMSSQAILPPNDLVITPFDIDLNFWDIMSMPLSSETNTATATSSATPGTPDTPAHRLPPPSSLPTPQEKHYICPCGSAFAKLGQLNAHIRRHKKPETCPHCFLRLPDKKGLGRHILAKHRRDLEDLATDQPECPHPNCQHTGREDNISRHYLKKHGGRLRWKRGKATVISGRDDG